MSGLNGEPGSRRGGSEMAREVNSLLSRIRFEVDTALSDFPDLFSDTKLSILALCSIGSKEVIHEFLDFSRAYESDGNFNTEDKLRLYLKRSIMQKIKSTNDAESIALNRFLQDVILRDST